MNKLYIEIILLFAALSVLGQNSEMEDSNWNREMNTPSVSEQIINLKKGAILVRLKSKKNSIDALRKRGLNQLADKMAKEQKEYNREIIDAFRENFSFCPVLFFQSEDSKYISGNQMNKVIFLNNSLLPDSTIQFNKRYFITAEFGFLEQDTAQYFAGYYYESTPKGRVRKSKYNGSSTMGFML